MKELINRVHEKPGTDMGDFWVSFLEMPDPLAQCLDACHARNGSEYLSSTYNMLRGLMAYDNHDYGRWLPDYWAMLSSLSDVQMEFYPVHDRTPLLLPASRSLDRNNNESELKAKARMDAALAE